MSRVVVMLQPTVDALNIAKARAGGITDDDMVRSSSVIV
jgi:hypothetical protein